MSDPHVRQAPARGGAPAIVAAGSQRTQRLRWLWPLLVLVALMTLVWTSGIGRQISWEALARHQVSLAAWVAAHPIMAPILYVLAYATVTTLSIPAATVITAAAGLLFGPVAGGLLADLGASTGAVVLFLGVRHHLAQAVAARRSRVLDAVREGVRRDGFSYLLAIRLMPIFPFWLVNLAAALSGMRLVPYTAATLIGMVPVAFIYASIGSGIGQILSEGGRPDLSVVFKPQILGALLALAALSLAPVFWRRWRQGRG